MSFKIDRGAPLPVGQRILAQWATDQTWRAFGRRRRAPRGHHRPGVPPTDMAEVIERRKLRKRRAPGADASKLRDFEYYVHYLDCERLQSASPTVLDANPPYLQLIGGWTSG